MYSAGGHDMHKNCFLPYTQIHSTSTSRTIQICLWLTSQDPIAVAQPVSNSGPLVAEQCSIYFNHRSTWYATPRKNCRHSCT